uniref:Strictosidine synthase conserved region domain-containing protein n=1 Tax=Wuchereria bancrofti TaxID=6293 RepID=A0AAF5PR02_WUCBA
MVRRRINRRSKRQLNGVLGEESSLSTIIYLPKTKKLRQFSTCQRFCLFLFGLFILIILALLLNYLSGPIRSIKYRLPKPPELTGALRPNQELTHAEILLLNKINGPESIAIHEKSKIIYVGLKTGLIAGIEIDKFKNVKLVKSIKLFERAEYNRPCDGSYHSVLECGRPLGMRFNRKNPDLLLIADAYYGFFEANVQNETVRQILKPGTKIAHSLSWPVVHFNDFDISQDGHHIVFTESSHRFADRDCFYAMIEHRPDGRLLHYNMHTGVLRVLIDDLYYPNGVEFDKTGKCVFFSEMGNLRILKYCFNYKSGKYMIVANNLPGYPDNIRTANNGMLWVPLGQTRLKDDSWITERPFLRDIIAMVVNTHMFMTIFDYLLPKYGLLLLINPINGTIMRSFHDPSGSTINSISQAIELNDGTILLGGDSNMFLARFKPLKIL